MLEWDDLTPEYVLDWMARTYREDPGHVVMEVGCVLIILWLLIRPSYDPKASSKLTRSEEDSLIAEWEPEPLIPDSIVADARDDDETLVLEGGVGPLVKVRGVEEPLLCFAGTNFLGLAGHEDVLEASRKTIEKYGVGSCGPRGFYGTIDVHLDLEKVVAEFYGAEEAILYSDSIATVASVIPAYFKKGDLVIVDEAANFHIQQGVTLSRSNVLYFKHNDMDDLERVLQDVSEKDALRDSKKPYRRVIVVEGISERCGDLVDLAKAVAIKNDYKYRLLVDDTLALGVLGDTGRGSPEYWRVDTSEIDFLCAGLDASIASVGGVCVGEHSMVDHQRLSGLGYCFSASSPPYTAAAAVEAFRVLEAEPERCEAVRSKAALLRRLLQSVDGVTIAGSQQSPVVHISLSRSVGSREADVAFLRIVKQRLFDVGLIVDIPKLIPADRAAVEPTLLMTVTMAHSDEQIEKAADMVAAAFEATFAL